MDTKVFYFLRNLTLNECQGHPNWYQNVELSDLYHQTKFEVWMKSVCKCLNTSQR